MYCSLYKGLVDYCIDKIIASNMRLSLLKILLLLPTLCVGNSIQGVLTAHAGQEVTLYGYQNFEVITLSKATLSPNGEFVLDYADAYTGMAHLQFGPKEQLLLVLNGEETRLNGTHVAELSQLTFMGSYENVNYAQYMLEHGKRENVLAGLKYSRPYYEGSDISGDKAVFKAHLEAEITRIEQEDTAYLEGLDKASYVHWYLPLKKLIADVPVSAQKYPERIPQHIEDFRALDLDSPYMETSGLLSHLLQSHYWLLENSGLGLDEMYAQMNISTDGIMASVAENGDLLNAVADHLFDYLERRSLFKASEYLALKLLANESCTLTDDLAKQLETYRAMKVGNTAKDLLFEGTRIKYGVSLPGPAFRLSQMKNKYTLVVFGASWCPKCREELPKLPGYYQKWKEKGLEVVMVSLDTDTEEFAKFVDTYPFLSFCDFNGWDTNAAQEYYVFSTPTMFLLDEDLKILVRPVSVEQVNTWVDHLL